MMKSKLNTKFIDKGFKDVQKTIKKMKDVAYIKIGILSEEGSLTPAGSDLNLAGIAAVNEFGTKVAGANRNVTIPSRPFIRSTMDEKKGFFEQVTYNALVRINSINSDPIAELNKIGLVIAEAIKTKITSIRTPPNAPSTIKAKGSSKPLIDTGRMRASIRHQVVQKGEEDK